MPADARGRHHAVETDAQGRITRAAVIRDGQKISERVYSFARDGQAASEYDTFTGAEKTGRVRVQRNAGGDRTREDYFTVNGAPRGTPFITYSADSVEATSYTSEGKKRAVNVSFYSPKDILTRAISYSNPADQSFHVDSDFDDRTGLRKGSSQFESGNLTQQRIVQLRRRRRFDPPGCFRPGRPLVRRRGACQRAHDEETLRLVQGTAIQLRRTAQSQGDDAFLQRDARLPLHLRSAP